MIAHRYDVLSDPQKRQIYDVYGVEGCVEINQCVGCGRPGSVERWGTASTAP